MAKRSSSSKEVLLGLLTIEPMSGYDLGQVIRDSIGHFWNESYGQIYPNLKKLAAEGFVGSKAERQKDKPDRRIYSIAPKGRKRLAEWLAIEPQPEIPRNELLLKLFFGAQASIETLVGFVERMAEREGAQLRNFERIHAELEKGRQYPGTPYWKMAARFGQIELDAHLRWTQESLADLNKISGIRRSRSLTRSEERHGTK